MPMQSTERLSDVVKLSAHVTRILGQNPGQMTLQGTNSYLLQPPSNPLAPIILIDTSSPHTASQYVDLLFTHLYSLGLGAGLLETHFESNVVKRSLEVFPEDKHELLKEAIRKQRKEDGRSQELSLAEYGDAASWNVKPATTVKEKDGSGTGTERKIPNIEHIILTHRHLDHVGALPELLSTLSKKGCPPPKIWKSSSIDEPELCSSINELERRTSDGEIWKSLPKGSFIPFSPLQPFHPIIPGLMISILDPKQKHLLEHDKVTGKPLWNQVPEIVRVSVRCLKTPGHTKDSISLVMLEGEKGVFTGDTVLGQGTSAFTELGPYMSSLRTLIALKPSVLYPAHGPHISSSEKCKSHIETYISHRQAREDEIISILQSTTSSNIVEKLMELKKDLHEKSELENEEKGPLMPDKRKPVSMPDGEDDKKSLQDAVDLVIKDKEKREAVPLPLPLPTAVLKRFIYKSQDERLLFAATKSVNAHLVKLEQEGKVRKVNVHWPKMLEGEVGESEEQEAWVWIGPKVQHDKKEKKKVD